MLASTPYETDGNEIYRQSFAIIRSESDLSEFTADQAQVAVRMIHAAGQTDLSRDIAFSPGLVPAARGALAAGAPIITDVTMVSTGVTRRRLPADNDVLCLLNDPRTAELAQRLGTTRSAAAVELWAPRLDGAVVAIGNAPTALFHLLDWIEEDPNRPRPSAIIGIPVGFVGAAESKAELGERAEYLGTQYLTVHGRRGGSAITCAALNALATEQEILS
ncbi:precorrin-8X methylmutase [Corynebacterium pacaense]|uniref:precorrin-8X methylmutase n=1 Tax=Corynebacterium pacaense TaxID=1816684 RepID=UPI0009BBC652|nr:precorrin-8X methylmutase [Corynebacterium pacaense]